MYNDWCFLWKVDLLRELAPMVRLVSDVSDAFCLCVCVLNSGRLTYCGLSYCFGFALIFVLKLLLVTVWYDIWLLLLGI